MDHDNAFLEHDLHSEPLILFFLDLFQSTHSISPRGFKLVVYTRFDCEERNPETLAHIFGVAEDVVDRDAPVVLELYCNTAGGFTGYHHDLSY